MTTETESINGQCDVCGEKGKLTVINSAPIAGMCICEPCLNMAQDQHNLTNNPEPVYYMPHLGECELVVSRWHPGIRNYDHSDRVHTYSMCRQFWDCWPKPPPAVERRLL